MKKSLKLFLGFALIKNECKEIAEFNDKILLVLCKASSDFGFICCGANL